MKKSFLKRIHKEGYLFSVLFLAVSSFLWRLHPFMGCVGFLLTAWCLYFFRDPCRMVPLKKGLVLSPADGTVQMICKVKPPKELSLGDQPMTRVSVFMNVFNVHVNRIPISGTLLEIHYHPGKFFNAELDKASEHNERQLFSLETEEGHKIGFVQIAGLIARRIRCDVQEGQKVKSGQRFGLIRFGSRVDILLPEDIQPLVLVGQKMIAGETVIADLYANESRRQGEWV